MVPMVMVTMGISTAAVLPMERVLVGIQTAAVVSAAKLMSDKDGKGDQTSSCESTSSLNSPSMSSM